ncbi:MAG: DNA cytosine methyltransferase [Phycisphaerae bacterium]
MPRLLDLFCGAGGAAVGYHRAGFDEIVGVDVERQPNYPFTFVQADALGWDDWEGFDLIHASPPCQAYSRMRHLPWLKDRDYPDLVPPTRRLCQSQDVPWVMENVEDAPMAKQPTLRGLHGVVLCGQMYGLPIFRHRIFESSFAISQPGHPVHPPTGNTGRLINKRRQNRGTILTIAGHSSGWTPEEQRAAMGIPWMTRDELTQAIPPAYTEYIGREFLRQISEGGR